MTTLLRTSLFYWRKRQNFFYFFLIISTLLTSISPLNAQSTKGSTYWYFGNKAGLTFTGAAPQALTDGQMRTLEGCAAQSNDNGQLLFYSDGSSIWNRNHTLIPGATGLGGSSQSTQSTLIVPYQNSDAEFYVFSVGGPGQATGIQYTLINTNAASGLGIIEKKNQKMLDTSTEKITTIYHCNNLNHWIITHDPGNNTFRVFLLNDNGLILTPKTSSVGSSHRQTKGYMKPSHDGKKLAVAVSDSSGGGFIELFDFDNKTGTVSNPVKLENATTIGAYGLEFSPDDKLLYFSTMFNKNIIQLSVDGLHPSATLLIESHQSTAPGIGALQLGPDNRIYGVQPGEPYLIAINQPNQAGTSCNVVTQAVSLGSQTAAAGLPFVLNKIPTLPPSVTISLKKLGGCNNFILESSILNLDPNYLIYEWYVNDVSITGAAQSTVKPSKSGTYRLKAREVKCQDVQVNSNEVVVTLVETNPTTRALSDSCGAFMLNAHATGGTVRWSGQGISPPRDQLDSLIVSQISGNQTFTVYVTSPDDPTCLDHKDVTVSFIKPSAFQLPTLTRTACGDTLTVQATPTVDWPTLSWQLPNGGTVAGNTLVARQSGVYKVMAYNPKNGCKSEASQTVTLHPIPTFQLVNHQIDTCLITSSFPYIQLEAGTLPNLTYQWTKDGELMGTTAQLKAYTYGVYRVVVQTPFGCQASDSVQINATCPPMMPVVNIPDAFSPNQDGMNEALVIYSSGADHMTLTIYNRWGEAVYTVTNGVSSQTGWTTWDGTFRGQPAMSGLYSYRLDYQGIDFPTQFTVRGVIQVIR